MSVERITIHVTDILTPSKAAEYLKVSRMLLWRWVKAGKITPVMLDHTYFHISELNRVKPLIEANRAKALKEKNEQAAQGN